MEATAALLLLLHNYLTITTPTTAAYMNTVGTINHHFSRALLLSTTNPSSSSPPPPPPMGSGGGDGTSSSFPIVAIALLAIMLTAFLLISYYIITLRWYCVGLNWQPLDSLRRTTFSFSRRTVGRHQQPHQQHQDSWTAYSLSPTNMYEINHRGLDEWVVRDIPTVRYKGAEGERSFRGCSVCLSEFEDQDLLRVLPHCGHLFHLDCVDVWLLNNANCPVCRSNISGRKRYFLGDGENIAAPSSSPLELFSVADQYGGVSGSFRSGVVVGGSMSGSSRVLGAEDIHVVLEIDDVHDQELSSAAIVSSSSSRRVQSQRVERKGGSRSKRLRRMFRRASIMGDECIDVMRSDKDEIMMTNIDDLNYNHHHQQQQQQQQGKTIRRSFSMDSVVDRQLYNLQIQRIARRDDDQVRNVVSLNSREVITSSSSSRSFRRLFFPFGQGISGGFGSSSNNNKSSGVVPI